MMRWVKDSGVLAAACGLVVVLALQVKIVGRAVRNSAVAHSRKRVMRLASFTV